ncbi:hypothetical protein J3369_02275 [Alteromonas sp. NFXS44]|uniref:hypothetical protein n=1 Tax=Alteromonas sp. NFXS44 TaxID=2818435 RepID=UPI0032DEAD7C
MIELNQVEIEEVSGGIVVALWALLITGYGSGAFDRIGSEIGAGLYDGLHKVP